MNIKRLWVGAVGSLVGVMAGCGGGDGASANLYDGMTDAEYDAIAVACECYAIEEFPSSATCEDQYRDEPSPTEVDCYRGVYEANAAALQARVDCMILAFDDASECLAAVVACDATAHGACLEGVDAAIDNCPDPSQPVQAALNDCEDDTPAL